jgi:hypothetical protein
MDLDDLKKTWKQAQATEQKTTNIMEMIHKQSRGPLAYLKKQFQIQLVAVPILILLLIVQNALMVKSMPGHMVYILLIVCGLATLPGVYSNYQLTSKMEATPMPVIENLEEYIGLLERKLKRQFVEGILLNLLLVVLAEVLPLFYQDSALLNDLHSFHPLIRFSGYVLFAGYFYFLYRWSYRRKIARNIEPLKELLNTMK